MVEGIYRAELRATQDLAPAARRAVDAPWRACEAKRWRDTGPRSEKGNAVNKKQAAEIEALMKQHDARTGERADDQRASEEFATEFCRLRREVIKPAMEQVAEKLQAGGHHAAISETDPTPAESRKHGETAAIRLEILPAGAKRDGFGKHDLPGVIFSIEAGMRVGVYSRSGRPDEEHGAGPMRRFRISEVTPEMVTMEILEVLKKTL
jgi:hypothetical protein